MLPKQIQEKGILAKLLEKGIKILLRKECNQIGKVKIDIDASSIQIIKGIINKVHIIAEEINYKDLLFDKIELEANKLKINLQLKNKGLRFKNEPKIKFKLSLSESCLKKILLSKKWNWITNKITKEILNQDKLDDLIIKNDHILIKASTDTNAINEYKKLEIKAEKGKIYLTNKTHNKSINIPIEDKVYVKDATIENNLIIVLASSTISF